MKTILFFSFNQNFEIISYTFQNRLLSASRLIPSFGSPGVHLGIYILTVNYTQLMIPNDSDCSAALILFYLFPITLLFTYLCVYNSYFRKKTASQFISSNLGSNCCFTNYRYDMKKYFFEFKCLCVMHRFFKYKLIVLVCSLPW